MFTNATNNTVEISENGVVGGLEDVILFHYKDSEVIVISILMYALSVIGISSNALLIANIVRDSNFHTVGYTFMAHLAGSEILMSVSTVLIGHSMSLYWYINGEMGGIVRWHLDLVSMALVLGYEVSVCIMLVLSINRLCSVVFYASYKSIFTKARSRLILVVIYGFTVVWVLPQMPVIGPTSYPYLPKQWGFALDTSPKYWFSFIQMTAQQVIASSVVLAMIVMYAFVLKKLKGLKKNRVNAQGSDKAGHKPKREDILLTVQFFVVTMIFVTMWLTIGVYEQAVPFLTSNEAKKWLTTAKNFMLAIDCNVNPIVYMVINKRIRVMILKMATCGLYKGENNASTRGEQSKSTSLTNATA